MGELPEIINMIVMWGIGLCTGIGIGAAITTVRLQKQYNADMIEAEQG